MSLDYYCKFRSQPVSDINIIDNDTTSSEALKTTMMFKPFLPQILQSHYNDNQTRNLLNSNINNCCDPSHDHDHDQATNFVATIMFDIQLTQCDCDAKCIANEEYIIQVGLLRIPNKVMVQHKSQSDNHILITIMIRQRKLQMEVMMHMKEKAVVILKIILLQTQTQIIILVIILTRMISVLEI